MSYDPKCEELARYFLPSTTREALVLALAAEIQQAVEDFLATEVAKIEMHLPGSGEVQ
jgi:hypothetical protein